jgi:hypothetical protein
MVHDISKLVKEARKIADSRDLPGFVENRNKCNNCGLKEKCYDKGFMDASLKDLKAQKTLLGPL